MPFVSWDQNNEIKRDGLKVLLNTELKQRNSQSLASKLHSSISHNAKRFVHSVIAAFLFLFLFCLIAKIYANAQNCSFVCIVRIEWGRGVKFRLNADDGRKLHHNKMSEFKFCAIKTNFKIGCIFKNCSTLFLFDLFRENISNESKICYARIYCCVNWKSAQNVGLLIFRRSPFSLLADCSPLCSFRVHFGCSLHTQHIGIA